MTLTQKILAAHTQFDKVKAGQLVEVNLDMVLGNDITSPVAINGFEKCEVDSVFNRSKISLVMDHFTPNKDIKAAEQCKQVRNFAKKYSIENFFDIGSMGIEHVLLPEQGLVGPGDCIIGADSHTCTYGALGAFSTGVGSTDMAAAMITGKAWLKVPSAIKFNLVGKPSTWISGKDIILNIIGLIGVDGARYKSIEFSGEGLKWLSMDDRFCISNMVIEAGAKNGIFPVDDITREYVKGRFKRKSIEYTADNDAVYEKIGNIEIDQVVIGSCTNGRLSDLKVAAEILRGRKINNRVRCIIIPATQYVYLQAVKLGFVEIFINAGAVVSTPTCGPCLGGHMGILASKERAVSTTNRNFVGRMGHIDSEVYLASPAVAAASAVTGIIQDPNKL